MILTKGHCLCGQVTFEFDGPANWQAHCHCDSCRRNTSSPFTSFLGVPRTAARFTGVKPAVFESSPGVRRHFCGKCGSPMAYDADAYPGEIHFYAASLEHPEAFEPTSHVNHREKLPWVHLADGFKTYDGMGPEG